MVLFLVHASEIERNKNYFQILSKTRGGLRGSQANYGIPLSNQLGE